MVEPREGADPAQKPLLGAEHAAEGSRERDGSSSADQVAPADDGPIPSYGSALPEPSSAGVPQSGGEHRPEQHRQVQPQDQGREEDLAGTAAASKTEPAAVPHESLLPEGTSLLAAASLGEPEALLPHSRPAEESKEVHAAGQVGESHPGDVAPQIEPGPAAETESTGAESGVSAQQALVEKEQPEVEAKDSTSSREDKAENPVATAEQSAADSAPNRNGGEGKHVQWYDEIGLVLTTVKEFEPSESSDADDEERKRNRKETGCGCVLM